MKSKARLPRGIWMLGLVSLFMDLSSEMIHAVLPLYMVSVLHASPAVIGLVEGIAEATAAITKIFSGVLSDRLGQRKLLAVVGYGLAACSKPLFPLAPHMAWLAGARFIDRVGKGIRGAPRDALVADLSPPDLRGAAFGLRQSLDTIGAFLAPLIAIALMWWSNGDFQLVFWVATVPALLSVLVLVFGVHEPPATATAPSPRPVFTMITSLGRPIWLLTGLGALFTLARFSEAFLLLRAQSIGVDVVFVPLVLVVMNIVYAAIAYPAGLMSDRLGRIGLLVVGLACLIAADLMLALATGLPMLALGVVLWGLHLGLTQGIFGALIADYAPDHLRATAFGLFNLASGIALFAASLVAGLLWQVFGAAACFLAGVAFAIITLICLPVVQTLLPPRPGEVHA